MNRMTTKQLDGTYAVSQRNFTLGGLLQRLGEFEDQDEHKKKPRLVSQTFADVVGYIFVYSLLGILLLALAGGIKALIQWVF